MDPALNHRSEKKTTSCATGVNARHATSSALPKGVYATKKTLCATEVKCETSKNTIKKVNVQNVLVSLKRMKIFLPGLLTLLHSDSCLSTQKTKDIPQTSVGMFDIRTGREATFR